jgi:sulfur-carrier protein
MSSTTWSEAKRADTKPIPYQKTWGPSDRKEEQVHMLVRVLIPTPLQRLTDNQAEVVIEGSDVREMIGNLEVKFPGVKARLCDENGALRRFVNIYVNEEDIRFLKGEDTALKDGDEVSIVPAIAGGVHV